MNAKLRSCLTAATAALATMALVLVANWPNTLDAKDPAPAKVAAKAIKIPTMTVDGCQLSILPQPETARPDQEFLMQIRAVNTTDKPVHLEIKAAVMAQSPSSMFSRRMVMPTEAWKQDCPLSLLAGETRVITLATGKKASALGGFLRPRVTVNGKHLSGRPFTALVPIKTPAALVPLTAAKGGA